MLTFAVIGPTGAGKSSLINSLVNERVCPIGVKNTTAQAATHKFVSDDKISYQIIDTPPDYDPTKLPQCDVLLYLADIGQGNGQV
jgi:GTPase Era involved in 16S rRNA processing